MPLNVEGAWELQSFDIHSRDGKVEPWGTNAHGLLLYFTSGHMSVSINSEIKPKAVNDPKTVFDSILFYSGTYRIDGTKIIHYVTEASNPARINREMLRFAELQGDVLTLTTPEESFGKAVLVWKKLR